jgi:glycolate oxidase FAD binding subunit
MKNVAGFDLVRLTVGSRGTLGIVVSASLRVFPRPSLDRVLEFTGALPDLMTAAAAVRTAPKVPASAVVVRRERGGPCTLLVRLHGTEPVVDADATLFTACLPQGVAAHEGPEAEDLLVAARDMPLDAEARMRLTALPGRLPDVLGGVSEVVDGAPFLADVMTGGVVVGLDAASEATAAALVRHARELGGSAMVLRGPPQWHALAEEGGPAATLAGRIRKRFDPEGVLDPLGVSALEGGA